MMERSQKKDEHRKAALVQTPAKPCDCSYPPTTTHPTIDAIGWLVWGKLSPSEGKPLRRAALLSRGRWPAGPLRRGVNSQSLRRARPYLQMSTSE